MSGNAISCPGIQSLKLQRVSEQRTTISHTFEHIFTILLPYILLALTCPPLVDGVVRSLKGQRRSHAGEHKG